MVPSIPISPPPAIIDDADPYKAKVSTLIFSNNILKKSEQLTCVLLWSFDIPVGIGDYSRELPAVFPTYRVSNLILNRTCISHAQY